jgi:hypothetical protein
MEQIVKWFDTNDHPQFERLTAEKMQRNIISFEDGYLNIDTLEFFKWSEVTSRAPPLTEHYFDCTFEGALGKGTPMWDNLIETQLGPRSKCVTCGDVALYVNGTLEKFCNSCKPGECKEAALTTCDTLELQIGRLFYPVKKHDNWQISPFLKGDANTGKSTVCDLTKEMFPFGSVGVITASKEEVFGFESLYQKQLILIPDMPEKFSRTLSQTDFQSMVSGDQVSVSRKHKKAITHLPWKVPMIFAGNNYPDYKDNSGSISRRFVVFPFDKHIATGRDTKLKEKIVDQELVPVMLRCIVQYRRSCDRFQGKDFWTDIAPESMKEAQNDTKTETNSLTNFIVNGDDYYQVIYKKDAVTTLDELEKAYSNHMRIHHKNDRAKIGSDYFPIKDAGFKVERLNICKECQKIASKEGCVGHYDAINNRRRKMVINNMQILTKKVVFTE